MTSREQQRRRELLKRFACVSLLGSGAAAMSGKMQLISSALATSSTNTNNDYRALVCVFLYGGADSFSFVVPTDDIDFATYSASRGQLAVERSTLLDATGTGGIAFNPRLPDLRNLYNDGTLGVVSNVGNLITPMTRADYLNESNTIPVDLFAHNHQQEQWLKGYSSIPAAVTSTGWGGRMADLLQDANSQATLPASFSTNGTNYWLPGGTVQPISVNPITGLSLMRYLDDATGSAVNGVREDVLDAILALNPEHALKQQLASSISRAKSGSAQLFDTLQTHSANSFTTPYNASSRLANQLRMVARLIASCEDLGMRRQVFFVGYGGWDTHDNQTPRLNALMDDLNRSLGDFQATIGEMNMQDVVTTFTASDFGRTLTINGDGSDHGWGGHQMVMGGAVNGGNLYGQLPDYAVNGADDSGDKGRIIPSLSINQYGGSLARWMGLSESEVQTIFPDLANFGADWQSQLQFMT